MYSDIDRTLLCTNYFHILLTFTLHVSSFGVQVPYESSYPKSLSSVGVHQFYSFYIKFNYLR